MEATGAARPPWHIIPAPHELPRDYLASDVPLIRSILWSRGYRTDKAARDFLYPLRVRLPHPGRWPALLEAATRIEAAIKTHAPILVWGDYDADGQTATALLVLALRRLGAQVCYTLSQAAHGHGLDAGQIEVLDPADCSCLVACDCGSNETEIANFLQARSIDFVVLDHHRQTADLPPSAALVNSTQLDEADPFAGLTGAGVTWLLARLLGLRRGDNTLAQGLLDLAAIGLLSMRRKVMAGGGTLTTKGVVRWRYVSTICR